ncbi:replication initiator protein [Sigmofec virus UA08Rod_6143]|uniref:Replication initiator protein n=1 Tax=Sigmofec virus UA08Rod_6143 TaxID=2929223 RepID=A0A976R7W6_9VIRU|nr:replication initiator protein [Sigmofec virus UA08Rod_6143]
MHADWAVCHIIIIIGGIMACLHPLRVYQSRRKKKDTGSFYYTFDPKKGHTDLYLDIPCNKCEGCMLARSYQWSMRCVCEAQSYTESYFLTLTYDNENLPDGSELNRTHITQFVKRLRWHFRHYKLKVFYCGEYGTHRHRPHYHMIVFGLPLQKENVRLFLHSYSRKKNPNYVSPKISDIWGKGLVTIGSFTDQSASYVAQYCLKKQTREYYEFIKTKRVKPFIGASNRNALGFDFFQKSWFEIFTRGWFRLLEKSLRPLRYFVYLLKKHHPLEWFKFIELPRRIKMTKERLEYYRDRALHYENERNKALSRYYRERKILRSLQERRDLL